MKHIKTYVENSEFDYKVGDYIRFSDDILNIDSIAKNLINCLKVIEEPHIKFPFDNELVLNVEYININGELDTSYLYLSQSGGYATDENIEKFETIIQSKKYNL